MTWQLIDGVIANDAFATPATPGTSSLVDGINNQAFATPASATAQPVDAVLGLTTWTFSGGGAVNYTLSGTSGAYAVTGIAATFKVSHTLTGSAGAYSATGNAGTFKQGHTLAGAAGSYAVVGQAATFKSAHSLSGASGSYSLTGNTATLAYVPGAGSVAYALSGIAASYAVTGQAAGFKVSHALAGSSGSYAITGKAATLTYTPGAGAVNYSLSGSSGSYSLAGNNADFTFSGAETSFSQEVDLTPRRYYVKRGKQILLFNNAQEADQYIEAQELADKAIEDAQKTSRRARKRLRDRVLSVIDVAPVESLELTLLSAMVSRYSIPVDLPALIQQEAWDRVMQIHALAMEMQDEDEIEMLLLM
jgi:hypothetical protein